MVNVRILGRSWFSKTFSRIGLYNNQQRIVEEWETWKPPNYPYQIFLLWKFDIDYWHLSRLFGFCKGSWQLPSIQFIGRGFYRYHNYFPFMRNPHKANIKQAVQLEWEYSSFLIDRGNDLQSGKMVDAHLTLWGWQFSWEVLGRSNGPPCP